MSLRRAFIAAFGFVVVLIGHSSVSLAQYTWWRPWSEVPGNIQTPFTPRAVWSKAEHLLYLFVTGEDHRVYFQTTSGGTFSGWSEVPDAMIVTNVVAPVAWTNDTANPMDDPIILFARFPDGRLHQNSKAPFGPWSGWRGYLSHDATDDVAPVAITRKAADGDPMHDSMIVAFQRTSSGFSYPDNYFHVFNRTGLDHYWTEQYYGLPSPPPYAPPSEPPCGPTFNYPLQGACALVPREPSHVSLDFVSPMFWSYLCRHGIYGVPQFVDWEDFPSGQISTGVNGVSPGDPNLPVGIAGALFTEGALNSGPIAKVRLVHRRSTGPSSYDNFVTTLDSAHHNDRIPGTMDTDQFFGVESVTTPVRGFMAVLAKGRFDHRVYWTVARSLRLR